MKATRKPAGRKARTSRIAAAQMTSRQVQECFVKMTPAKQTKFLRYLTMLAEAGVAHKAIERGMKIDWDAVALRLGTVRKALDLDPREVRAALLYRGKRSGPLVAFAKRNHVNLNWLVLGDVDGLCRALAWSNGWRPRWWDADMEAVTKAPPV